MVIVTSDVRRFPWFVLQGLCMVFTRVGILCEGETSLHLFVRISTHLELYTLKIPQIRTDIQTIHLIQAHIRSDPHRRSPVTIDADFLPNTLYILRI